MDILEIQPENFVDLFGNGAAAQEPGDEIKDQLQKPTFQGGGSDVDLFENSTTSTTTEAPQAGAPQDSSTTTTTTEAPGDVDILGEKKPQAGRKPKYDFTDTTGYFKDRIEKGKFVPIEEQDDKGEVKQFIPSNPEEFDEFLELQVNHRLTEKGKDLEQKIYQSKSPAWQAVLKYSEMVDDPTEILPFIQGVKTIQSVSGINETEPEGAEQIIRVRLQQRGDDDEVINEQIEALKSADKLISTAQKYKPIILQEEHKRLQQEVQERKQQEAEYQKLVTGIKENALKAIEAPIFGKQKLKNEEKMLVYDLIAEPAPGSGGYGIFKALDDLFAKGDFETLRDVALLLAKKDSYLGYASNHTADGVAAGLQRQLRVAGENRASAGVGNNDDTDDTPPKSRPIQRNSYATPRFGR